MVTLSPKAVRSLLAAAPAQKWHRQLAGAADVIHTALGSGVLPAGLVDAVLDADDPALLAAMAKNPDLTRHHGRLERLVDAVLACPGGANFASEALNTLLYRNAQVERMPAVRERLASSGHPAMAEKVLPRGQEEADWWSLRLRRRVLAGLGTEPAAPTGRGTLSDTLAQWDVRWARAAVVSPVPAMVRAALTKAGELSRAEQLRAALSLHDHAGGGRALASLDGVALRPEVADLVRGVAASGDADALRRAVAEAEGTAGALEELYEPDLGGRADLLELRDTLDWPAVLAAVRERPLDAAAAALLTARADCPDDVRDACYATQPLAVAEATPRPDARLLAAECGRRGRTEAVRVLVRRTPGRGVTGAELLENCRPAVAALAEAGAVRPEGDPAEPAWREFTAGLAKLVEEHAGGDVGRWLVVRALLPVFDGPVTELLAAAAGEGAPGAAPPVPDPVPVDGVGLSPADVRAAFQTLLDLVPFATLTALRPHVDPQTAQDMVVSGRWRPEWLAWVLDSGSAADRRLLACRPGLDPDAIERLAALDDPEVNAMLFFQHRITDRQRRRLLAGTPFGAADGPVPLHPDLVRQLLAGPHPWRPRDAIDCADLRLQHHIMREVHVVGRIPQLRLMLNIWQRHGQRTLAELTRETPISYGTYREARETVERLLARSDPDAALAELRAEVARGESAEGQIAAFRRERRDRAVYVTESHDWHWDELLAEHRRAPFTPDVLGMMQRIADCPAEIRAERVLFGREAKQYGKLMKGVPPADVLAEYGAGQTDRNSDNWLVKALGAGRVTWADALEHGHSAREVLGLLSWPGNDGRGGAELAALIRATIGDDPDAWTLALRLLPDFPGPVAELLRTAATAVR
ncbi:hypothetical protein [Marinitenerispora sediminis]|uniref:Uncharacterized protein n=1 Tax=Marinitenerispora sediminis TaxID=1931232 RepID=A0A368T380_9ACTN|nr:hypothetical protein [Marinitenerispora sediminis]RCV50382.1 hypothetical protein DEF28_18260 [Marinitenerispora sediminis]RCV53789.1 hypothetical protein DEF23_16980 [Marinitenerispora sediminis]RCV56469.1 hypothetical protein DEF24_16585 [Marinitenerispora sediminis]